MGIQKRRLDHGWSQEDLALHSGLSTRTIRRLESGNTASLESLKCLASVFETTVSDLVQEQTMTETYSPGQHRLEQAEKDAIAYVQNLRAFHMNWIAFIAIMPCLLILNVVLSPQFLWVGIVGACWVAAIGLNALVVFSLFSLFGGQWEQLEFQKRMKIGRK
jgi:transcriptional regulator with XRE-family HTH domain